MPLRCLPPRQRRQLRWIVLLLVMLLFATHPEVRLMVPVLDAIGLDVLLMLFGAQIVSMYADMLLPLLRGLRYAVLAPALQWLAACSRRWPLCRSARAWTSRALRRVQGGRALWLRLHVVWWGLVRRAAVVPRRLDATPMTEPSRTLHWPHAHPPATVAATFLF